MNKLVLAAVAALLTSSAMAGPSAKFAATYHHAGNDMYVVSMAETGWVSEDTNVLDSNAGYTLATIKVPQDKELLVSVSAEVGLTTDTGIKGKLGGSARALAGAAAHALVVACPVGQANPQCYTAKPGSVTMASRIQELSATLGGVLESCTDGDLDGTISIADDCVVSDEEIGLILQTLAAHHFEFVLPNMNQGEYHVKVFFMTDAQAAVDIDEDTVILDDTGAVSNISAMAAAKAWIGSHMVTVQQVRATSNGIIDAEIVE